MVNIFATASYHDIYYSW